MSTASPTVFLNDMTTLFTAQPTTCGGVRFRFMGFSSYGMTVSTTEARTIAWLLNKAADETQQGLEQVA